MALSADAVQVLRDINSWWPAPHHVRPEPPAYERRQVSSLHHALTQVGARIQVLRGPRQVGKSTAILQLVQRLIKSGVPASDILLIRFDLEILRERAPLLEILRWFELEVRKRPLAAGAPAFLFLDEIHKIDRWSEQVKHAFDTYRPRMALTGSSSVLVARGQRESLAGRALTIEIPPFQFREVLGLTQPESDKQLPAPLLLPSIFADPSITFGRFKILNKQPAQRRLSWSRALDKYFNRGGYPDLHTGAVEDDRWADYLIETVFDRVLGVDIPDLFPVTQPRLLRHLYMEVARRTGQEIAQKRLADEANDAGYKTNQPTVGKYLHYLTDALLIREFRRYPLIRKASAKVPVKYTLTDLGVRNAIFRGAPSLWESSPDIVGPLVETVVQSVLRGPGLQVHFFRQPKDERRPRDGYDEVDFVVEATDGTTIPVEVKFRRRVDLGDVEPLSRYMGKFKSPIGIVVTRDTFAEYPLQRVVFVPLLDFLLSF